MPDSLPGAGPRSPVERASAASQGAIARPDAARGRAGAVLGWLWAFALILLLALDVWMQTEAAPAGAGAQLLVWGLLFVVAVGGPWFLVRAPAAGRALGAMPIAVLCYLVASLAVMGWSPDARRMVLLFVAAGLAGCAGMIIAIAGRNRRKSGER